jgi:hypothetical protein
MKAKKQKEILKAIQTVIENKSFEISFSRNSFPKLRKKSFGKSTHMERRQFRF